MGFCLWGPVIVTFTKAHSVDESYPVVKLDSLGVFSRVFRTGCVVMKGNRS